MSAKSPLAELRELNVRKQRESTADEAPLRSETAAEHDHTPETDNMTGHITDNMTIQTGGNTDRNKARNTAIQKGVQQASQTDIQPAGQPSIKESIKAAVQGGAGQAKPVLKTVTIKLSPELDKRVEDHCHATGRLKQEVIRDGLLLYFEAVEGD